LGGCEDKNWEESVCKQWRRVNIDPNDRLITEKTK